MRGVYGMELTKKERILVYKDGISNNAVKNILISIIISTMIL